MNTSRNTYLSTNMTVTYLYRYKSGTFLRTHDWFSTSNRTQNTLREVVSPGRTLYYEVSRPGETTVRRVGQNNNTPNIKERLFPDLSLWALGNSIIGLSEFTLSAVFKGNFLPRHSQNLGWLIFFASAMRQGLGTANKQPKSRFHVRNRPCAGSNEGSRQNK